MNESFRPGAQRPGPEPQSRAGLALRLWAGCVAGVAVTAAGGWWAITSVFEPGEPFIVRVLVVRLGIAVAAGFLASMVCATWLTQGILKRVRGMTNSMNAMDVAPLHDPSRVRGWGELSDLRAQVAALVIRSRQSSRAADQIQVLERQIEEAAIPLQRWAETERWVKLPPGQGPLRSLTEALNRGFARHGDVLDQNFEAVRQVQTELGAAVPEARAAAEQAERGFVEATALLTTIQEIQRLGGELQAAVSARDEQPPAAPSVPSGWLTPAADAIHELVTSASESIDHLTQGLGRVQELADNVHVLGNRSTLIALNTLLASGRPEGEAEATAPSSDDLKQLAREARAATDRVQALSREIEADVQAATESMKGVRERIGDRLATLVPPLSLTHPEPTPSPEVLRIFERVREMIQDATAKAERTSAAGESASRMASELVQRLDEEVRDLEGLAIRLLPADANTARNRREATRQRMRVVDIEVHEDVPPSSEERR